MKKIDSSLQSITKKDSISLEKYFNDISKEGLISAEQEVELAKRIREGDRVAEERLVSANLRFVVTVAKQYQGQGIALEDLISFGNIGLIKAARKFDETRGFKFISYAVWWIKQSIIKALCENSRIVRIPTNKIDLKSKIAKAITKLRSELDREPTYEEISKLVGESPNLVKKTILSGNQQTSLDEPLKDGEEGTLVDVLENENAEDSDKSLVKDSMLFELEEAMVDILTQKETKILKMFFGIGQEFPLGCEDIGTEMKLGSERIRQIKDLALRRLKAFSKKDLKAYL